MRRTIVLNNQSYEVDVIEHNATFVLFQFEGEEYSISLESNREGKLNLKNKNEISRVVYNENSFVVSGKELNIQLPNRSRNKAKLEHLGSMTSPMPGKILKILKKEGDSVLKGDALLVMEAMKMEHTIKATKDAVIEKFFYKEGDQVKANVDLVKLC